MKHILRHIFIALLGMYSLTSYAEVKESTNNWYVGNTQPGDWIQYKKVWLSAGHYRFTGRIVGNGEGQTVHLEINGSTLKNGVEAPYNYTNTFDLAHLGHKQLEEGYYDLKLVFETGNVNCDMVFIRKDDNTSDNVLDTDIDFENNWNDGMHTFAIGGHAGATRELAKGGDSGDDATWTSAAPEKAQYSRNQVISWNKQSIYNFNLGYTQEAADIYISEMVESKVEVIFAHGRGEPDGQTSEEYDIEDRIRRQVVQRACPEYTRDQQSHHQINHNDRKSVRHRIADRLLAVLRPFEEEADRHRDHRPYARCQQGDQSA